MAFAGMGAGLASLGAANIGERAINEISEIMTVLAQPTLTRTVNYTEGRGKKQRMITDVYTVSKLDVILVAGAMYAIWWLINEYIEEESDPVTGEKRKAAKRSLRPFGYGLSNIVDPFNFFGMHEKEEDKVEELLEYLIP